MEMPPGTWKKRISASITKGMITAMAIPTSAPEPLMSAASIRNCRKNFLPLRADCFANADLAGALGHGDQHDVHDADATDSQRQHGDQEQHDGQRQRDVSRDIQNRSEVLHVEISVGTMAASQNFRHLPSHSGNVFRAARLHVQREDEIVAGVIFDQRKRHEHRIVTDFGLPEGGHAFAEGADTVKVNSPT